MHDEQVGLSEPWEMAFSYTRTAGPVVGRFLRGLAKQHVLGLSSDSGQVQVPPTGYDAHSAATLERWVDVQPHGSLVSWAWIPDPLPTHPHREAFAWALVQLAGADTHMLHTLLTDHPEGLHQGMKVRIRWAKEPRGHILDIACFEPATDSDTGGQP